LFEGWWPRDWTWVSHDSLQENLHLNKKNKEVENIKGTKREHESEKKTWKLLWSWKGMACHSLQWPYRLECLFQISLFWIFFGSWDLSLRVMLVWTFAVWVWAPTCVLQYNIDPYIWTSYVRATLSISWGDIFTSIYYFINFILLIHLLKYAS